MKFLTLFTSFLLLAVGAHAQTYAEWVDKSFDELESNNLAAAQECLEKALKQEPANPNNFALLTNLGTIQHQLGKTQDAVISYSAALNRIPTNIELLATRASLYIELGENEKAIQDFDTILQLEPDHQESLYYRGLLYLEQEELLSAENDFAHILEVNTNSVKGRLGYALMEKQRGNYDESEKIYNFLISKRPRDWSLYEGRADLYFRMGKNARAMADIHKVFAESEPTAFLYVLRGKVKLAQYENDAALKDFAKAIELGYDPQKIQGILEKSEE